MGETRESVTDWPIGASRLDRARSLLLVVDIQERLAPHVLHHEQVIARSLALIEAAALFRVPKVATEHCPAQIGRLVMRIGHEFAAGEVFKKTNFGAADHPEFVSLLRASGRTQVVVTGMEAHVCVMQTALGLAAQGFDIFVIGDAIGSRAARQTDRQFAVERMRNAGCALVGAETVLFEWTQAGDDVAFKKVLELVKALPD
jgi:nicotinamidase-related amidase